MSFRKYNLTDTQLARIARLCVQEQGNMAGIKAEASQAANLLETNSVYRKKYGDDIYTFMRTSGWYYKASYFMDNGNATSPQIEAVREVLCEGRRTLPQYVDEHDCLSDIRSISTGSVHDKSAYIQGKTIIRNKMGSTYTFWCFPAPGCDPFGYTAAAYKYVKEHGGGDAPEPVPDPAPTVTMVSVTAKLPVLRKGARGKAATVWQAIVGADPDGIFGEQTLDATVDFQTGHGLDGDGIVGAETWTRGLEGIT